MKKFRGSFVALATPFRKSGRVDWKKLEGLVDWHVEMGSDGIVCCASTGEGPTLSESERRKIAQICIERAAKRIQIIVSTGLNDTRKTVQATEQAMRLGADGCLVVTPYYNKPTQRGCILHFQEVAKVGLPLIVYHNPGRAAVKLTAETMEKMSQIPGIVGFKDSAHDLELLKKAKKLCPNSIFVSGDDDFTFDLLREGGDGAISVIGNIIPQGWGKMIRYALEGKWEAAKILFKRFFPLCKALFYETNPQCIKWAMSWLGQSEEMVRLPLVVPLTETQREIKKAILPLALPQFENLKLPQTELKL